MVQLNFVPKKVSNKYSLTSTMCITHRPTHFLRTNTSESASEMEKGGLVAETSLSRKLASNIQTRDTETTLPRAIFRRSWV